MMNLALGLITVTSAYASEHAAIQCKTNNPQGTDLVFTVTDSTDATFGHSNSLFIGMGNGEVRVRPVRPLKIQYPTQFAVMSAFSKKAGLDIFPPYTEGKLIFSLRSANPNAEGDDFPATIQYGDVSYNSVCQRIQ